MAFLQFGIRVMLSAEETGEVSDKSFIENIQK
jgi:hypothetical protein